MRKNIIKRLLIPVSLIIFISVAGCIKETYDMNMLSKQAHLSPTLAISAVKGDVALSDMVKTSDTVVFGEDNLVILVFRQDAVVDLKMTDFSKGNFIQDTATIEPGSFDTNLNNVLSYLLGPGSVKFLNPSLIFSYVNSFHDSLSIDLNVRGRRAGQSVILDLEPFALKKPGIPVQQEINADFIADRTNSNLPDLVSLLPERIDYSGDIILSVPAKGGLPVNFVTGPDQLTGSLELEVPLDLRINNLQFADTIDNFMNLDSTGKNNPVDPADFQFLRIRLSAKNGFPLGATVKMSLYDSTSDVVKSSVIADAILKPAPVGNNGKAIGTTETSTVIEFTREFFSLVNKADKIIFTFTLNTTGGGSQDVKIYSDYRIDFNASLVVKPDIKLN